MLDGETEQIQILPSQSHRRAGNGNEFDEIILPVTPPVVLAVTVSTSGGELCGGSLPATPNKALAMCLNPLGTPQPAQEGREERKGFAGVSQGQSQCGGQTRVVGDERKASLHADGVNGASSLKEVSLASHCHRGSRRRMMMEMMAAIKIAVPVADSQLKEYAIRCGCHTMGATARCCAAWAP